MRALVLTTLLATLFLVHPGTAGAEQWLSLGPLVERSAAQVEIDAAGPQELYALHDVGVLRSRDGGATWELGGEGLREATIGDVRPVELLAYPDRPGALYATVYGVGLYRSFDGGAHWHPAGNRGLPTIPRPQDLEAHPTRPSTLYLATVSDWIFVSEDRGDSWSAVGTAPPRSDFVSDLAIDPEHPETLYAVGFRDTISGANPVAAKSEDGGASWQSLDVANAFVVTVEPTDVVVTSGGPGAVFIASEGGGILRSTDGGATWTRADTGLPASEEYGRITVAALAVHPSDPSILYASTDSRGEAPDGVFRTLDGGDHWEPFGDWPAGAPAARDLEVDPADPSVVLAAPGPYVSPVDPEGPWLSRGPVLPSHTRFLTPHPIDPAILFVDAGTATPDLRRTTDSGDTWEPFARNLPVTDGFQPGGLVVDPKRPQTLYLFGKRIFKSEDGGLTWIESDDGVQELEGVGKLAVSPRNSTVLYASNTSFLYRSIDAGGSWTRLFDGAGGQIGAFALDPGDPEVLYVATTALSSPDGAPRVCRSTDGGGTWTCVSTGLEGGGGGSLKVDPADPERLYLAGRSTTGREVLRSPDGGASWSPASQGLPEVPIRDLVIDPGGNPRGSPSTVWVSTDGRGVYRSRDGGESWIPVYPGMGPIRVNDLAMGPGGLYAATTLGVFRFDPRPGAGEPLPPDGMPWLTDTALPGFRFKVRIDQGGGRTLPGTKEPTCIPETVCVSGALPGRSELFVRIVGPKPNRWLWPTLVKFSTSRIEIWIQQLSSGRLRYYELAGASPDLDELPGLFDRFGFPLVPGVP